MSLIFWALTINLYFCTLYILIDMKDTHTKKSILLIIILCLFVVHTTNAEQREPITLKAYIGYGYNYTYKSYANIDVKAEFNINNNFELDAAVEGCTANTYTIGTNLRPKFALPVGEMYVETKLIYCAVVRNKIHDFNAALSLGYRMDYVNVQIGMFGHLMSEFKRNWHSEDEILTEPLSMIYNVEAFVRPQKSIWNLSFRISNFDDYQIERFWQPMFFIGGRYNIKEQLQLLADISFKPAGMFHLDATFYGMEACVGVGWTF